MFSNKEFFIPCMISKYNLPYASLAKKPCSCSARLFLFLIWIRLVFIFLKIIDISFFFDYILYVKFARHLRTGIGYNSLISYLTH
jgi:hypothetical protein